MVDRVALFMDKLTELTEREAEVYRVAFEKDKELTDRLIKLVGVGEPKSNWELRGVLGPAAFLPGLFVGR